MKIKIFRIVFFIMLLPGMSSLQAQLSRPNRRIQEDSEPNNQLLFFGKSKATYDSLFRSINNLVLKGEGTINIFQIGDSHIQAGFFPEEMRRDLSSFIAPGCGARGLIFPYRIAKTNNPVDYTVKFTGIWTNCRNVELKKSCSLGIMGIMVQTTDTAAGMTFHFRENSTFNAFNFIRIFHDPMDSSLHFVFPGLEGKYKVIHSIHNGYTDIRFTEFLSDSLRIRIVQIDTVHKYFTFYGIDFENGDAGIVYSAAGINGAEVSSYLRCDLFQDQLKIQKPAWVIISLGTNDAYPLHFSKDEFIRNYIRLINEIREADPGVPVLLTVPGDSYRRHRYDNLNLSEAREAIIGIARQTNCAVWDFYSLMGGPKSIMNWYKSGLVARDKLHFDKQGYIIQADMLFQAFVDAYSSFIDNSVITE